MGDFSRKSAFANAQNHFACAKVARARRSGKNDTSKDEAIALSRFVHNKKAIQAIVGARQAAARQSLFERKAIRPLVTMARFRKSPNFRRRQCRNSLINDALLPQSESLLCQLCNDALFAGFEPVVGWKWKATAAQNPLISGFSPWFRPSKDMEERPQTCCPSLGLFFGHNSLSSQALNAQFVSMAETQGTMPWRKTILRCRLSSGWRRDSKRGAWAESTNDN